MSLFRSTRLSFALQLMSVAALPCLACSPKSPGPQRSQNWEVTARVALDEGTALAPDDPSKPGQAGAQALSVVGDKVFVAYSNLYNSYPAGPSWVSVHDAATLARTAMIRLEQDTGDGHLRCENAGSMRAVGNTILVACAGYVPLDPSQAGSDGVLVELDATAQTITRMIPVGNTPGAIAQSGTNIWLADIESPTLLRVDATSGQVLNGKHGKAGALPICKTGFASDLLIANGRGFATCLNDDTVQEFDPVTGSQIGSALPVGDTPVRLAFINGQLAVVNSNAGTVSLLSLDPAPSVVSTVYLAGTQGGDDAEGIDGDSSFTAVTNAGFGTLVILDTQHADALLASVDLKDSSSAGTNDPYNVVDVNDVFYVAIAGWGSPTAELARVARVSP